MSISEKNGNIVLNAADLENVIGGSDTGSSKIVAASGNSGTAEEFCTVCNKRRMFLLGSGGRAYCRVCGNQITK